MLTPSDFTPVIGGSVPRSPRWIGEASASERQCVRCRPFVGGAAMTEEPGIIQMNIDRYREMLSCCVDDAQQFRIQQLLSEAIRKLALTTTPSNPPSSC